MSTARVTIDLQEYNELIKLRDACAEHSIIFTVRSANLGMGYIRRELILSAESPLPEEILALRDAQNDILHYKRKSEFLEQEVQNLRELLMQEEKTQRKWYHFF